MMMMIGSGQYTETTLNYHVFSNISIGPEELKKYFQRDVTIASLVPFYPKLSEEYPLDKNLALNCKPDFNKTIVTIANIPFKCNFTVVNDGHNKTILPINKLLWQGSVAVRPGGTERFQVFLNISLDNTTFYDIQVDKSIIPIYKAKQLLAFLEPLNARFREWAMMGIELVKKYDHWIYKKHEISYGNGVSLIFEYRPNNLLQ